MIHWYDKAYEELELMLDNGDLTEDQFKEEVRHLKQELNESIMDSEDLSYDDCY
jgi:hypothetical protein